MNTGERTKGAWFPRRLARGALLVSIPLAVVVGARSIGWTAAQLKSWNDGDVLKADDINGNFTALSTQLAALSTQLAAVTAPLTWAKLPLMGGWAIYGSGYADPSYSKDALGIVHLRGLVKGTPVAGTVVANLPDGFRPAYNTEEVLPCGGSSPCTVAFKPTGEVIFELVNSASTWLSFDGLSFSVGP
jgi:hypothetical protein